MAPPPLRSIIRLLHLPSRQLPHQELLQAVAVVANHPILAHLAAVAVFPTQIHLDFSPLVPAILLPVMFTATGPVYLFHLLKMATTLLSIHPQVVLPLGFVRTADPMVLVGIIQCPLIWIT
jgi:hypothetical protein